MEAGQTLVERLTQREHSILERLAAGLSDQQIASELFLSLNTIKWYNRQIYSKLGVTSRTQAILQARIFGLLEPAAAPRVQRSPTHNLPARGAPFIGRRREISEVTALVRSHRLLTLTGTAGIGKTRLAIEVAAELTGDFPDGVYFIDLAPLADSTLVANAMARAFGLIENSAEPLVDTLKRVLAQRQLLLVTDNFEHVIDAAPLVTELLGGCPQLKIVATSREPLRLTVEQVYPVPPLSVPAAASVSRQELRESEAAQLFVQRAQMTQPRFEVTDDNAQAVAEICRRLDGLPLAIELAAARSNVLTPQALFERLSSERAAHPLHALSAGPRDAPLRHKSLRDAIAWSYNLLDPDDRTLFERLAVFHCGRTFEAVEAVCGLDPSIDVFDGLASLLDKNLIRQQEGPGDEPRFAFVEMILEYARERLEASGEGEALRRRHAYYFLELAERAEPELRLAGYDRWCQRLELEMDNFRAALEWSLGSGDISLGVRLAGALGLFWYGRGYHVEGRRWIERLQPRLDETPLHFHSQFLISAGHVTWMYDLDAARQLFLKALDVAQGLGDRLQSAWARTFLAFTMQQDPEAAQPIARESLALFRELDHQPGIAQALNIIGVIANQAGEDDVAKSAFHECLRVCRQTGEARRIGYMLHNLAFTAQHEGDSQLALDYGRQAAQLARQRNDVYDLAAALHSLAGAWTALVQPARAARLLGAHDAALERIGGLFQPDEQRDRARIIASIQVQLDPAAFSEAMAEGRGMTLGQAVAYALEDEAAPSPAQ